MRVLFRCLAVLGIGIASVLVSSTGSIARATPPGYELVEAGPFPDLATCNSFLAVDNSPPTIILSSCGFFASNPRPVRSTNNGPGYYFLMEVSII
jgi:hypothetical protein